MLSDIFLMYSGDFPLIIVTRTIGMRILLWVCRHSLTTLFASRGHAERQTVQCRWRRQPFRYGDTASLATERPQWLRGADECRRRVMMNAPTRSGPVMMTTRMSPTPAHLVSVARLLVDVDAFSVPKVNNADS